MRHYESEVGVFRDCLGHTQGVDADYTPRFQADQRATRIAVIDGRIRLDHFSIVSVGLARNDAARARVGQPPGVAERTNGVANGRNRPTLQLCCAMRGQLVLVDLQDREIQERIHIHLGRIRILVIVKGDLDIRWRSPCHMGIGHDPAAPGINDKTGTTEVAFFVINEGHRHRYPDLHRIGPRIVEYILSVRRPERAGSAQRRNRQ